MATRTWVSGVGDDANPCSRTAPCKTFAGAISKTDPRGVLTYTNDVFLRTSALTEAEALGQPHNIIRHPDMPRGVFWLLWDTIQKGEPIGAYVKNKAKDGSCYWVDALIVPLKCKNRRTKGYLSVQIDITVAVKLHIELQERTSLLQGIAISRPTGSLMRNEELASDWGNG